MTRKKQDFLPGFSKLGIQEFGGSRLKGNAREARPISTKRAIHLVMRSSLAKGERSFLKPGRAKRIEQLVHRQGRKSGVRVYRFANSGNHLHLVILPRSRKAYAAFIRAISGLIARITLGTERGKPLGLRFWDSKPFTRVIEWGREFNAVCGYVLQNTLEAIGFIAYQARARRFPATPARNQAARRTGRPPPRAA